MNISMQESVTSASADTRRDDAAFDFETATCWKRCARFYQPLRKHPFWILSFAFVLVIAAVCVDNELNHIAQDNARDALFMAAEAAGEVGVDYVGARQHHAVALGIFSDYRVTGLWGLMFEYVHTDLSRDRGLQGTRESLGDTKKGDACTAIWDAGESFFDYSAKARSRKRIWFNFRFSPPRQISQEQLDKIDGMMSTFTKRTNVLRDEPTPTTTESACEASRDVTSAIFLSWEPYHQSGKEQQIEQFKAELARARDLCKAFAKKSGNNTVHAYARSMDRRIKTLEALEGGDPDKVRVVLIDSIKWAKKHREECSAANINQKA